MELNGHDPEIDDLHRRPDQEVGLQRRDVDILELALNSTLSTTLSDSHVCKESRKTSRCKQELIERDTLERRYPGTADLCNRKSLGEETEPAVLDRRHKETVGHEADCALKIEGRRQLLRIGDDIVIGPRVATVEVMDLDCKEVILACAAFANSALADGGQSLSYCVCNTTKDLSSCQLLSNDYSAVYDASHGER